MTKLVLITGGAGGMGLATAHVVGRDATVLISDVDPERLRTANEELADAAIGCFTAICDVTERDSVRRLIEQAQTLGNVTSVIHTAGVSPSMGSAEVILRINALGTVNVANAFHEIAAPGAALVNVSSVAGHQLPAAFTPRRRE